MKKKSIIAIIIAIVVIVGGGYAIEAHSHEGNSTKVEKTQGFTITDSTGQKVHFDKQPEKIVCLDGDAYNIINMLGGDSKVVGVAKLMTMQSNAKGKEVAGTWQDPNVSKILSLKADVVFAYAQYTNKKAVKELEDAGVKVVYINGDNISTLKNDVQAVGMILGKTQKADEFNKIATKYMDLVKERLAKVPQDKKVNVYIEEYEKDQTAGKGSAAQAFLDAAGVNNIAVNNGQFATVNPSWILSKNPDMVIKLEADGMGVLGSNVESDDKVKKAYEDIVSRPGWKDLKAVKDNKVYLMDSNYVLSDPMIIPGLLYVAKFAYPQEFKDINPAKVQQEIQKDFLGQTQKGILMYSGTTK